MNDLKELERKLRNTTSAAGTKLFQEEYIEEQVKLLADSSISPAKFKKHPFLYRHFLAHPETIAAVKNSLFLLGNDFIDLERPYRCQSCNFDLDLQFWRHCPRCGAKFAADI